MVPKKSISAKLVAYRRANNLTQKQLAELLNVSRSAISLYEIGEREPDAETLLKIADLLEISLEELLRTSSRTKESAGLYRLYGSSRQDLDLQMFHRAIDLIWEKKKAGIVSDDDLRILEGVLDVLGRKGNAQGQN